MLEIMKILYDSVVVLWYFVFFIFLYVIYIRNVKPYKVKYEQKIRKKYPSKLNPAELSLLFYKKIIPEVFTASILSLIRDGKIKVKKIEDDYLFTVSSTSENKLSKSQEYILDILFNSISKEPKLKLSDIEKYASDKSNSTDFFTNYYVWRRIAHKETLDKHFFEEKSGYNLIVIYRQITDLLIIINFIAGYHNVYAYLLIIISFILSTFFYHTYKRTEDANEEYHKWKAFQNYLLELNNEKHQLDKNKIFDFLIYGTVLKTTSNMSNDFFEGVDELAFKLNKIIKKCIINAELYAYRKIQWK